MYLATGVDYQAVWNFLNLAPGRVSLPMHALVVMKTAEESAFVTKASSEKKPEAQDDTIVLTIVFVESLVCVHAMLVVK